MAAAISYLGGVRKLLGVAVTTHNWNRLLQIARVLEAIDPSLGGLAGHLVYRPSFLHYIPDPSQGGTMSRRLIRYIAIIGTISLAACTSGAQTDETAADETAADETAVEKASPSNPITQQEVEQTTQEFINALRAGDATALPNRYADDGVFVSASGKFDSGDAIKTFWTDAAKAGKGKSLQVTVDKFGASGDLAYAFTRFTGGVTAPGGYTLQVWQRGADGVARIVSQISIPDAAIK